MPALAHHHRYRAQERFDSNMGFQHRRHRHYDNYTFKSVPMKKLLEATSPTGSFDGSNERLATVYPAGLRALQRMEDKLCPFGCTKYGQMSGRIWLGSVGTSQQLHFDWAQNVFVHLAGQKTVVLLPPNATFERSFIFPKDHFGTRHSQLLWTNATASREPMGFSSGGPDLPSAEAAAAYPRSEELHAVLQPGDVLFMPLGWGHQTFTSLEGASLSAAFSHYPAVDPRGRGYDPNLLESTLIGDRMEALVVGSVEQARTTDPLDVWASLRHSCGILASLLLGGKEAQQYLSLWKRQRWYPLFTAWGLPDGEEQLPIPADLCRPRPAKAKKPHAGITDFVVAIRRVAADAGSATEALVVRQRLGDVLDSVYRPVATIIAQRMQDTYTAEQVASFLVRSVSSECGD